MVIPESLWVILPLLTLLVGAFAVYLVARLLSPSNHVLALCTAAVFAVSLWALVRLSMVIDAAADPALASWLEIGATALRSTPGARFLSGITLALGLCVAIYSGSYISLDRRYHIYYPLILLLSVGILGMLIAVDLFAIYLFCELMSITAYVLVAFRRHTDTAIEAGFKYLILGSVATLSMLMGIAWIHRETGSIMLPLNAQVGSWGRTGVACFLVGLALKSGIVPLHTWLPDAYGRAPSSVGAFLAGVASKSTLILMVQVGLDLYMTPQDLGLFLIIFSFVNMTTGNLLALVQPNSKRLLAYSSIAQAGYIMFALGIGLRYEQTLAIQAGFFLLAAHAVMKGLAFLSKGVAHFYTGSTLVSELQGTFQRLPLVAFSFTLALLGLVGFPPLAGFSAKWLILSEALGPHERLIYAGIALFLVNTLVSLGAYLPLVINMFKPVPSGSDRLPIPVSIWMVVPVVFLSVLVLVMGVYPGPWLEWSTELLMVRR
jgi:F420H2 dehydrogenase subunit N